MIQLKHNCDSCDSQFTISYDAEVNESDPTFCPFCGEYLLEDSSEIDDE
jgi:hypothetical protein